jgi:large repetitive protein
MRQMGARRRRGLRTRFLTAATLAMLVTLGGGSAQAAGLIGVTGVEPPAGGARGEPPTTGQIPTIDGTTTDTSEAVQINIFEGEAPSSSARVTLIATPNEDGMWSATVPSGEALPAGTYTAVAEQEAGAEKSFPFLFAVSTAAPTVTLNPLEARYGSAGPTFSGSGSEAAGTVVVHVLSGGTQVDEGTGTVSGGGTWSAGLERPLAEGSYEVHATETSLLGNGEGTSAQEWLLEVVTKPPAVTLAPPVTRSRETAPTFKGTGSEDGTKVVVHVLQGSTQVDEGTATVAGGTWSAGLEKPLKEGGYEVYATETSGLGNDEGRSLEEWAFEVVTRAPTVTLEEPPKRTKETEPVFAGAGSEEGTEVEVHVYSGGHEVGHGAGTVSGGRWSAGLEKPLVEGSYTVYATEASALGNKEGTSEPWAFEVVTARPTVTLAEPVRRSNGAGLAFSGSASEDGTEVIVHVLQGSTQVDEGATIVAGGTWSVGLERPLAEGAYTVYATETSGVGNGEGRSAEWPLEVVTKPPTVVLEEPAARSSDTTPTFSGTGSENGTEVTVHVLEEGREIDHGTTTVVVGAWSAGLEKALPSGEYTYTVYATEKSGLPNDPEGESQRFTPELDTSAPKVKLTPPLTRSGLQSPTFSGTGSEEGSEVVVHVTTEHGEEIVGKTKVAGGTWSTSLERELPNGEYDYTVCATEKSELGNEEGHSQCATVTLDTEAPKVSLTEPAKRTSELEPTFSGTGSEEGTAVEVRVEKAATGEVIGRGGTTVGSGGKWSAKLEAPLPRGEYRMTVQAIEASALEHKSGEANPSGLSTSFEFELDTEAPKISLSEAPPQRTRNTSPVFSGTGSEEGTEVVVKVINAKGEEVGRGKTTVRAGGTWSTGLEKALPAGKYATTVQAFETSGLPHDPTGETAAYPVEVDTEPPTVSLEAGPKRSADTDPTFSGTGSEEGTQVVVHVVREHIEIDKGVTSVGAGGAWSAKLERALPEGQYTYTVYAMELSGLGNGPGQSAELTSELDTKPPTVSLESPPARSNVLKPEFSGTGSEAGTTVEVRVLGAGGELKGVGQTTVGANGAWAATLEAPLPAGEYATTVQAIEISGLGNAPGKSAPDPLEIDTDAPKLTLEPLPLVSADTTPTFDGASNETSSVTIYLYKGAAVTEHPLKTLVAKVGSGAYKTTLGTPLEEGEYTAVAKQPSSFAGNPEATTLPPRTFKVATHAPEVAMDAPAAESRDLTPKFSGTVIAPESEMKKVKVVVHEGASYLGPSVGTLEASVVNGRWETGELSPPLLAGRHTYTAVASTESAIGTGIGESAPETFVVNTEAPAVVLDRPESPSNNTQPTFSGTTSEEGEIVVHVLEDGKEVTTAQARSSSGRWDATLASALPPGEHQYVAYATQESAIGNGPGKSAPWSFEIDTLPPTVTVTQAPAARSSDRRPPFLGTASDDTEVTVAIHEGGGLEGPVIAELKTKVDNGEWSTQPKQPLEFGEYTAVATQPSSIHNPTGTSAAIPFTVAPIPPVVTTQAPASIGETSVALYGTVDPQGGPISSCAFEIGTTTAYERQIACALVSGLKAFPAAATGPIPVFARAYGLTPDTLYHLRLVADGEGGAATGADETFTTLPEEELPGSQRGTSKTSATGSPGGKLGVLGLVAEQLLPSGRSARIAAVLRAGGYTLRFQAPEAGTLVIRWYRVLRGQKLGAKGRHAPTLVAAGHVTVAAAGASSLKLRLTAAGRLALRESRRISLLSTCAFAADGGQPVTSSAGFRLAR